MAMTSDDWLAAVKTGMHIQSTFHDAFLKQKTETVKDYMSGAGVTDDQMETPLGIGIVVLGVRDTWNEAPGAAEYSSAFHVCLQTLKARSLPDTAITEE